MKYRNIENENSDNPNVNKTRKGYPQQGKPYGTTTSITCRGCNRSFRSKTTLSNHEKICPNLKMGRLDSFSKLQPLQAPTTIEGADGKVLPSSQPLHSSEEVASNTDGDNDVAVSNSLPGVHTTAPAQPQNLEEATHQTADEINCPICKVDVAEDTDSIVCDMCHTWFHRVCLFMPEDTFSALTISEETPWFCATCLAIKSNKIKWGSLEGEVAITREVHSIYDEIVKWRKNIFLVPRGKVGTDLIKEIIRLLKLFINPTKWSRLALALLHIFLPLMLQKPSSKSKARDHVKYLEKRLKLWKEGDLKAILAEN